MEVIPTLWKPQLKRTFSKANTGVLMIWAIVPQIQGFMELILLAIKIIINSCLHWIKNQVLVNFKPLEPKNILILFQIIKVNKNKYMLIDYIYIRRGATFNFFYI